MTKRCNMAQGGKLSPHDAAELERFEVYVRLVSEAVSAGCTMSEAANAIYPDLYADSGAGRRGEGESDA